VTRRRSRIPGTRRRGTLYVLPEIRDDWPAELKDALAIRNACATEGRCPGCGAVGELSSDADLEGVYHLTFRHEAWCGALTDGAAA
jgi:hypothetical protein